MSRGPVCSHSKEWDSRRIPGFVGLGNRSGSGVEDGLTRSERSRAWRLSGESLPYPGGDDEGQTWSELAELDTLQRRSVQLFLSAYGGRVARKNRTASGSGSGC